jgi:hypothetical protein
LPPWSPFAARGVKAGKIATCSPHGAKRNAGFDSRITRCALHPGYKPARSRNRESINSDHIKFKQGIGGWYRRSELHSSAMTLGWIRRAVMNIKQNARAALLGIVIAAAVAPAALATTDLVPPISRGQVLTDPCAKAMNWPLRSIILKTTPPSERGLQCPIQQDPGLPLE